MIKNIFKRNVINHFLAIRYFSLVLIVIGLFGKAAGQEKILKENITVLPVPAIGYSPETKTYLGVVTLFTLKNKSDTLTRTSNAKIEFNYSWNHQIIMESDWNWFSSGEKWFSKGLIHYSKYPDLYYGIGYDSPSSGEINFQSNRTIINVDALRNITKKLYLGLGSSFKSYRKTEYINSDQFYPELVDKNSYGINLIILNDSRNNILSPSEGNYFQISNSLNFSSGFYLKTQVDYRNYMSLGETTKHVLAGRIYHSSVIGDPPFFDYPMIGGDEYARGYYLGRFMDRNISFIQLEHRMNLFWKVGMAAFGGLSVIYNNYEPLKNKNFKPNAGIGIRFMIDKNENTNLRIDYARGVGNQSGFYISFGESF